MGWLFPGSCNPLHDEPFMRHFKFIGGPWDGTYHEVDEREYWNVAYPSLVERQLAEPVEVTHIDPMKICQYTLREFATVGGNGSIKYYADSQWGDMYTFSQLLHHYRGRP